MSQRQEELRKLLHRCVTDHIHRAHQAYALCRVIGDHSWTINREGLGSLFHALQISLADEMVLSITKLLEADRRRPRRSIPAVLDYLDEHAAELDIVDRSRLEASVAAGPDFDPDRGPPSDDEGLTRAAVASLRKTLPKPKTLWIRRDKQIAHAEDTDLPDGLRARWDEAQELIEFAQRFAATVGESYGVFFFEANDGTYMLSRAAEEASRTMEELLSRADLLDPNRGERPKIEYRGLVAEAEEREGFWFAQVIDADEPIVSTGSSLEDATEQLQREIDQHLRSV